MISPPNRTRMRSRQGQQFAELGADVENRRTPVALLPQETVHALDCADVEPARRLRRDEQSRVARGLARDDDPLLMTTGERADADPRARGPNVVARIIPRACSTIRPQSRIRWRV